MPYTFNGVYNSQTARYIVILDYTPNNIRLKRDFPLSQVWCNKSFELCYQQFLQYKISFCWSSSSSQAIVRACSFMLFITPLKKPAHVKNGLQNYTIHINRRTCYLLKSQ
jgi:hypothetical protein